MRTEVIKYYDKALTITPNDEDTLINKAKAFYATSYIFCIYVYMDVSQCWSSLRHY
jgi:hypothetical protein